MINWQQQSWQRTTLLLTMQFSYQMQKRTHSPSQYCVWEGSVKIQSTLGRRRSIRFRIRFNKENWIESMWSRWSSSGKNFPGFTTLQILAEIQQMIIETKSEPEQCQERIIFMLIYNDTVCGEKVNKELCIAKSRNVAEDATRQIGNEVAWNS